MTITPVAGVDLADLYGQVLDGYHNRSNRGDKMLQWSLRAVTGALRGKVVAHADEATMRDCRFMVDANKIHKMWAGTSPRGTKRDVFAWIRGTLVEEPFVGGLEVNIHPKVSDEFIIEDTSQPVYTADAVAFGGNCKCWI